MELAAIVGVAVFIYLIGTPIIGKEYSTAAAPPIAGGVVAGIIMGNAAKAKGLDAIAVFATLLVVVQGFIGYPIASICLMNRAFGEYQRKTMPQWIEKVIKNTCEAYGCEYGFKYEFICSPTINNDEATKMIKASVNKVIGMDNIINIEKVMGSEDFSEYSALVPGALMFLGGRNDAKNCCYSHHSNHFDVDEDAFPIGVASYAQVALDYLK